MANTNQPRGTPANKMLIDATHPEETRVVVLRNGRVEEFDYESAARKLLRGNIYLAKVTRVEPSLQAAFVDYGGNRHGFLAFNEIHPDYYQIPVADRRALLEAEAAAEAEDEAAADRAAEAASRRRQRHNPPRQSDPANTAEEDQAVDVTHLLPPEPGDQHRDDDRDHDQGHDLPTEHGAHHDHHPHDDHLTREPAGDGDPPRTLSERMEPEPRLSQTSGFGDAADPTDPLSPAPVDTRHGDHGHDHDSSHDHAHDHAHAHAHDHDHTHDQADSYPSPSVTAGADAGSDHGDSTVESVENGNGAEPEHVETVSSDEDALEELPSRPRRRLRSYKIQEVIKRRQVILIQVVKEERGTKGAALTTYLSLAGRYTVLMPNTARGGGISRKITNAQDRKRLKAIASELEVPEGMGLIIRTAGAARTKQEIKRDYDYLLRLWESVRELAINSNAPTLVYEEGNLIKRSIRDLYGKEVDEIVVAGGAAFTEARDFMRMLMPSHAKNVLPYDDAEPLFSRYQIERQLNAMFSPYVHLRSGGYLVINQTEALVAIDINSGKSTREFSIEDTALSTNMEAADEIARQLKLRDLAGLIVVDFIDMEEKRNNRNVERRLKDALRHDRARIQVGRISHFGLLEMSRQRMRTGVLEGSTSQCPHCQGTGIIRSTESVALAVLRGLEDTLMSGPPTSLIASTTATAALYILNNKRQFIIEMETRYGISIQIVSSDKMQGANFAIERTARRDEPLRRPERAAVNMEWGFEDDDAEAPSDGDDDRAPSQPPREGREPREEREPREGREAREGSESGEGADGRKRRRRRRRGGRREDVPAGTEARGGGEPGRRDAGDDNSGDRPERGHAANGNGQHRGHVARDAGHDDDDFAPGDNVREIDTDTDIDTDIDVDTDADGEGSPQREAAEGGRDDRRGRRGRRRGRRGGRRGQERGDRPLNADGDDAGSGTAADADVTGAADPISGSSSAVGSVPVERYHVRNIEIGEHQSLQSEPVGEPALYASMPPVGTLHDAGEQPAPGEMSGMPAHEDRRALAPRPEPDAVLEAPQPVPVPLPPEPPKVSPRTAPVASEPVLERVVVGPEASAAQQPAAERAARRGWWQRK